MLSITRSVTRYPRPVAHTLLHNSLALGSKSSRHAVVIECTWLVVTGIRICAEWCCIEWSSNLILPSSTYSQRENLKVQNFNVNVCCTCQLHDKPATIFVRQGIRGVMFIKTYQLAEL